MSDSLTETLKSSNTSCSVEQISYSHTMLEIFLEFFLYVVDLVIRRDDFNTKGQNRFISLAFNLFISKKRHPETFHLHTIEHHVFVIDKQCFLPLLYQTKGSKPE